jgi:anti-sigma factor RsiW
MDPTGHEGDICLFAYVDGELDLVGEAAVERAMATDPEVLARIRLMQEVNRLLRDAYRGVMGL